MTRNLLLKQARRRLGWSQQQLADVARISLSTVERAERGDLLRVDTISQLCNCFNQSPEELGLFPLPSSMLTNVHLDLFTDELLLLYDNGIKSCQDLYYDGHPQHVEALLPLYCKQTALLANNPSLLQVYAARLASQAFQLFCELATDREDYGSASQAGKRALFFAQQAKDRNLEVNALISLANLGFHRRQSRIALDWYLQAVAMEGTTHLLQGRAYAGLAEVRAMRGEKREALSAMEAAYQVYPMKPEDDPAYQYLRASRYALYVFGDAQSRLFLQQPEAAEQALLAMRKESRDPEIEPITMLDMLYYEAEILYQKQEMPEACAILRSASSLASELGSSLYAQKLAITYQRIYMLHPHEAFVLDLKDIFSGTASE